MRCGFIPLGTISSHSFTDIGRGSIVDHIACYRHAFIEGPDKTLIKLIEDRSPAPVVTN